MDELMAELEQTRKAYSQCLEALLLLFDCQNGPPLLREKECWDEAMRKARECLSTGLEVEWDDE